MIQSKVCTCSAAASDCTARGIDALGWVEGLRMEEGQHRERMGKVRRRLKRIAYLSTLLKMVESFKVVKRGEAWGAGRQSLELRRAKTQLPHCCQRQLQNCIAGQ